MRRIMLAIALTTLSLSACADAGSDNTAARAAAASAAASANEAAAEAQKAIDILRSSTAELCQGESTAAERIMSARQAGIAMSTVMAAATKQGEPYVGMVRAAYETPRLSTDSAKELVQGEFRDTAYSECLKRWEF